MILDGLLAVENDALLSTMHATYKLLFRDNGFPIPPEHFVVLRVLEWHRSADRDESVVGIREMRLIIAAKNTSPDAL